MTDIQPHASDDVLAISNDDAKRSLATVKTSSGVDLLTMGRAFAASGYFPDARSQAQAVTKILAGAELKIPPVASMQGFHCIPRNKKVKRNGREEWVEEIELSMSANLRAAVIHRDPNIDLRIVEHTTTACEVEVAVRFAGQWEKRGSVRFTIEDAARAQVPAGGGQLRKLSDGPMWKNYPADMLYAAVMRRISKRYAPHLFIGDGPSQDDDDLVVAEHEISIATGEELPALDEPRSEYWDRKGTTAREPEPVADAARLLPEDDPEDPLGAIAEAAHAEQQTLDAQPA